MKKLFLISLVLITCNAYSQSIAIPPARQSFDTVVTVSTLWKYDSLAVRAVNGILRFTVYNTTTDTVRGKLLASWGDTLSSGTRILILPAPSGGQTILNYVGDKAAWVQFLSFTKTGTAGKIAITAY